MFLRFPSLALCFRVFTAWAAATLCCCVLTATLSAHNTPATANAGAVQPNACVITNIVVTPQACNGNGTFGVQVQVFFTTPPATGTLNLSIDGVQVASAAAGFVSPIAFTVPNVVATPVAHVAAASFSATVCMAQQNFASPAGCYPANSCTGYTGCFGGNLFTNGDFTAGNAGFTSSYTYNGPCAPGANGCSSNVATPPPATNDIICQGSYGIANTATPCNKFWSGNLRDHTDGTGNFFMLDFPTTNTAPNNNIWCETVTLLPATDYCLNGYLLNLAKIGSGTTPPAYEWTINGGGLGTGFTSPEDETWHGFGYEFNSGAGGSVAVCLTNTNFGGIGFDGALDDIAIRAKTAGTLPTIADDAASICNGIQDVTINVLGNDAAISGSLVPSSVTIVEPPPFAAGYITNVNTNTGAITFHPDPTTWTGAGGITSTTFKYQACNSSGCCSVGTVTVTQYASVPSVSIATTTNVHCNAGADGALTTTIAGGASPYTYIWAGTSPINSANSLAANVTGLTAGTYTVTATDAHGCTATTAGAVTQPASPLSVTTTSTAAICVGDANGTATATAANGTPAAGGVYTYVWSSVPAQNTATATALAANTYTVTATDANGCTAIATAVVAIGTNPTATVTNPSGTCPNTSVGTLSVTTVGTSGTVHYAWSFAATLGNQDTPTPSALPAGTYTVTTTNGNGCTVVASGTVAVYAIPSVTTASAPTNVDCKGNATGAIALTATGGTSPYGYTWSGGVFGNTANISGLTAGTYTATATDAHGCTASFTQAITEPTTALTANITATAVQCHNAADGSATTVGTGGTLPYTFHYFGGQATAAILNLPANTYYSTVTDANGCTATASTTLTNPAPFTASVANTAAACAGVANGALFVTTVGAQGVVSYGWSFSPNINTANPTALVANSYAVTATDANNCTATATGIVAVATPPVYAVAMVTNVLCKAGTNGAISTTAVGGTMPYTYAWSGGIVATTPNVGNLTAGTYTATVTDARGCTNTITQPVTEPATALTAVIGTTAITCNGGSNGTATATVTGGTAGYTYLWSNGGTASTIAGLSANTYTATVTDAHGCTVVASTVLADAVALVATVVNTTGACPNISNGSLTTTVANSTAPSGMNGMNFVWSFAAGGTNQNTPNPIGLPVGTYTVTATDANGCTAVGTGIVAPALPPALTIANTQSVSCKTGNDGILTITATGGNTPYLYAWSSGAISSGAVAGSLAANTYTATVTDARGCTASISSVVTEPVAALSTAITQTPLMCALGISNPSNATATLTATPSGGTAPYTYHWINNQNAAADTLAPAGVYSVTTTDAKGCTVVATTTVVALVPITVAITNPVTACLGTANGTLSATVTNNLGAVMYAWSFTPNQNIATPANLSVGNYAVTVTDTNGCTASGVGSVAASTPPVLTVASVTSVACFGTATGAATVSASGGTMPYGYAWSGGIASSTVTANGLVANTYTATVTDARGCKGSTTVAITEPFAPLAIAMSIGANLCNGGNTATATATPLNGTPPYTYAWSNVQTTATATALTANTYTVTVTDARNCQTTATAVIADPVALVLTLTNTRPTCTGASVGILTAVAANAAPPVTYTWSPVGGMVSGNTYMGLGSGNYFATATDANGCTAVATATVAATPLPVLAITTQNVSCLGGHNGILTINTSAGTPPFAYTWAGNTPNTTNASTSQDIAAQLIANAAGYIVTVTDAAGCIVVTTLPVTEPAAALTVTTTTTAVTCKNGTNGTATATATGGTAAYAFLWTNGATTALITNLTASTDPSTYIVTVTDANSCTATTNAYLAPAAALVATVANTNTACPTPANGALSVSVLNGLPAYTYAWAGGILPNTATPNSLAAGTYTVTVTDNNGCTAIGTGVVALAPAPTTTVYSIQNANCKGSLDGAITLTTLNGLSPYVYTWSGGITNANSSATNLAANTYTITTTDAHGCTTSTVATVGEPTMPFLITLDSSNVKCHAAANGTATANANGGTMPYVYSWSDGQITATAVGLDAQAYTVTVSDAHGCHTSRSVALTQPPPIRAHYTTVGTNCKGEQSGLINRDTVSGGNGKPYTSRSSAVNNDTAFVYTFTGKTLAGLVAGNYTVRTTDTLGCTVDTLVVVPQHSRLALAVTQDTAIEMGQHIALHVVTGVGSSTANTTLTWSPNYEISCLACDAPLVSPIVTTAYSIVAKDVYGCADTARVNITVRDNKSVFVPNIFTPNGDGRNDYLYPNTSAAVERVKLMQVFDRFGEILFEKTNFAPNIEAEGFDGYFHGRQLNIQVLIYRIILDYYDGTTKEVRGDVMLMR